MGLYVIMIIGFEGGLGSGKTIGMVEYLLGDYKLNRIIRSNFDLYQIEYEYVDLNELLEKEENEIDLNNLSLGIDEIQVFVDCRISGHSKKNRLFSYFVLQTRKRNVNLYYTTQDFGMVDFRVTNHTSIQILCDKIFPYQFPDLALKYGIDEEDGSILDVRKYTIMDFRDKKRPKVTRLIKDISLFYDYYDTDQKILPF